MSHQVFGVDEGAANKRRAFRSRVFLQARYVSANLTLEGRITDVSPDGLFFQSDYLDDQGELARVWVQLPTRSAPLELRGEVRWVNDAPHAGGMGLRLFDVGLEDRLLLSTISAGPEAALSTGNA
jgi:hypothetical protein